MFNSSIYEISIVNGSWDFDGNNNLDALTDGLLFLRYTFGLRDEPLTKQAFSPDTTLTQAQIMDNLDKASSYYGDIDGDGRVDALSDGLILLRYLFGIRDELLTTGVLNENSDRNVAADVEAYIQSLMPDF
jgi:hypothetical protein